MATDYTALAHRFYDDAVNKGDLDVLSSIIHDDFVEHEEMPGVPRDREAPRAFVTIFRAGFSDLHASIEDIIQQDDKIAVRVRMTGTHDGAFMGIPPTGKRMDMQIIDIVQMRDDKAVAHWGVSDMAAMMSQLGLIDMPAPTG